MTGDIADESFRRLPKRFRSAADCLRQSKPEIIEKWLQKVREHLPAAQDKTRPMLLDSLTDLLDEIIESLDKGVLEKDSGYENAKRHGLQRSTLEDYDLSQILVEYQILRSTLFSILDEEVEFQANERNIILDLIHIGISIAAEHFSREMIRKTTEYSIKLRQTEERLRLAFDYAKIGVFDDNFQNGELIWSERMKEIWGYRPGEFTGELDQFWSHVPPEDRIRIENAIELALKQHSPFEVLHRVVWNDGSVHWVSAQGQLSFDEKGKALHLAGVAVDVTEKVESERRLKMSEELFRLASRATQDLIWDWDILRNRIRWNEALSHLYGYPEELNVTTLDWWAEHIHPGDLARIERSLIEAIKKGESRWREDYRFKDSSGHYRFIVDRGSIVRDENGQAIRMVGAMQDETAERQAQEKLRLATEALEQSEVRFRSFFDNASVGLAEVDPFSRKYIRVNPKYCQMLGYTAVELLQKSTSEITHPDDISEDSRLAFKLIQGEIYEIRREKRYVRKDGSILWAEINISSIRDSRGDPLFNITVVLDISVRKDAQEKLFRALQQLRDERVVRERFVFALTHDLRTPLTAAKMSTQLALRNSSDPDQVALFSSKTIDALSRTDRMIQDLLDVSQINAGLPLAIKPKECDFSKLVREVCDELTVTYGVRFRFEITPNIVGYWSYKDLRRAVENLGSNAAKYGDLTRPITVKLTYTDDRAELQVHNFGPAIPIEDQSHIFDSFLRSKTATSKGWGLGLNLVKGVAEAHHGTVRVESNAVQGTTFTMTLPIDYRMMKQAG